MTNDEAIEFIRSHHRGILVTARSDGLAQTSPIVATVDDSGYVIISTRETARKTLNLRKHPWATLCVVSDAFFGPWVQIEGPCEVVSLPDAMEGLVEYYRSVSGEHDDWNDYRAAMVRERRVLLRINVERSGPTTFG